jgi:ATP-dependent helicase HrpA
MSPFLRQLETQIAQALAADRFRLRNQLRAVKQAEEAGQPFDKNLDRLQQELEKSRALCESRRARVPKIDYDENLPVVARREEIARAIRENQVVVISGETGSGKSTQIPKICLEIGRGIGGMIGHTQPRRIAARSIAARLAEELRSPLGKSVGFKIRFADSTSPETLIKVMTDGVLLAESQSSRFFDHYDTLIIDEAHERSLNIDFLLGLLVRVLPKRPDLKLIITSATIDAQRFAEHFRSDLGPAPVIEVTGRTYPVELRYRPLETEDERDADALRGMADAVDELCRAGQGDVLVFLPTERDIREAAHKLRGRMLSGGSIDIVPLYARLSTAEQNRVFQSHSGRRIVLATNVAESSLTVPGIRYVVDTGTARISRYSARSKVQRLPVEAVSQASADQRKGRCGRIGPGICIRLYSEEDFRGRDRFTSPEIQRTNLAAVILQTLAFDLGPIDEFPFLDPPRAESIRDGYKTLYELGAISEARALTPLGQRLARLPVDPRIGRMLLAAHEEHSLADVLIIAAALETQDPRDRPADRQHAADEAQAKFADADSDFIAYLKLWDFVQHLKETVTRSQQRKAYQQNFLSEMRLREWQDVHRQLVEMVRQFGLAPGRRRIETAITVDPERAARPDDYAAVHRALLTGLLSNIAQRSDTSEYNGAGGNKFFLWPGSGVFARTPKWIAGAELVETTRRYIRTAARIDPDWIEPLATHLVSRSYSDPNWERRSATVLASERVSLFGLTIVPRRRVRYGPIDAKISRELFIQQGLVEREYDSRAPFFRHNGEMLENMQKLAAKTRRREMIVDDHLIYRFYDERLPAEVYDGATLDRWRKQAEPKNPQLLFLREADLLETDIATGPEQFPDKLEIDRLRLPLEYTFEPGGEADGITVTVPREGLSQLSAERVSWLVPGLLEEKVEALVRSLPKQVRRTLGPAPDIARRVVGELQFADGPFLPRVAQSLSKIAGERITPDAFTIERLPPHLLLNVRVVDDRGQTLAQGRDLAAIRERVGARDEPLAPAEPSPWHRDGLKTWDFGALPKQVEVRHGGVVLTKYPALVDAGDSAALRLVDSAALASEQTRAGARRLFAIAENRELKAQVQWLPKFDQLKMFAAPLCQTRTLQQQVIDLLADRAFYASESVPRNAEDFQIQAKIGKRNIVPSVQAVTRLVTPLLEAYHEVRLALEQPRPPAWQSALADIREQLAALTFEGFLTAVPDAWLKHYPRYLKGIASRLKKLASSGVARDAQAYAEIASRWKAYQANAEAHRQSGIVDPELTLFRWMLEEQRVSSFAQELGASMPISPKRLDKQWEKVQG